MRLKQLKVWAAAMICFLAAGGLTAYGAVPYETMTQGPEGRMTKTQAAYVPAGILQCGLNDPEDLFVSEDGTIYLCDTGNRRIVIVGADGALREITGEELVSPTGLYVTGEGIYVADYGAGMIHIYGHDGSLLRSLGRPQEAVFGKDTRFAPRKAAVDARGNIYVVSEGETQGLIQISGEGNFLGYLGSNQTNTSWKRVLQKTFFTEDQMKKLFRNVPPSVTGVDLDDQGLIYTVTKGLEGTPVKKLSMSGKNLFTGGIDVSSDFVDAAVDRDGNVFGVTASGMICEFDSYGQLLFSFGGSVGMEKMGILGAPSALEIMPDGRILVLDKARSMVVSFQLTAFALQVHEGIRAYRDGRYEESETVWQEIRRMNSAFLMPYEALAKASYKKQDYRSAMEYYRTAENKKGYSQALWAVRNQWMEDHLAWVIGGLAALWLALKLYRKAAGGRSRRFHAPFTDQLAFCKTMLKSPIDGYYELRFKGRVSLGFALALYVWLLVLRITGIYGTGYLFQTRLPEDTSLAAECLAVILPLAFWILCNYLVSTIRDGEGKLRDVFCGTACALSPWLIFALPLQLLSNILTQNEAFVYQYGRAALIVWCGVLLFLMVKEIHAYSVGKTIANILVTGFTIAIFAVILFVFYLLTSQLCGFVMSVVREVGARV